MFETTLSIEPKLIALADKAIVTVRIVGTQPLQVAVPTNIFDEATSLNWSISPFGTAAESRDGARFIWQQQYELSPFMVGNALPVQFSSFAVNNTSVALPVAQVSVTTSIQSLTTADVRPVTPLELYPVQPQSMSPIVVLLGVLVCLGAMLCGLCTWLWLRRKPVVAVPSPIERLRVDLENWPCEAGKTSAMELAKRVRAVFLEPTKEDHMDRFARLDRWMYSAEVPTTEEMHGELLFWREEVTKQLAARAAAQPTVML